MLNVLILSALVGTTTMNSTVDIGVSKQIEYHESSLSETLVQDLFEAAGSSVGDQLVNLDDVYEVINSFAGDYDLIAPKGFRNIRDDINSKRNSNYDFAYLDDSPSNGTNNHPSMFFGPRPGFDFEYGGGEGGGETPTLPSPKTEEQITAQYGAKKSSINGKIDGKIFIGISANAAMCVSLYNSLLNSSGLHAVGGPTPMAVIIEMFKTATLYIATTQGAVLLTNVLQPLLAYFSATPVSFGVAVLLYACISIAAFIIIGMAYAGYHGKGFRSGVLRQAAFKYKYITELWS